jgi:hypothetical protein
MRLDMGPARRVLSDHQGDTFANNQILDAGYKMGEFAYLFLVFDDLFINKEVNKVIYMHLCEKIRVLVKAV